VNFSGISGKAGWTCRRRRHQIGARVIKQLENPHGVSTQ
jgi:hypothetical protein